ncbi:carboxypeptidase-like regulatory domain-containing protein [Owenweeksia hongkongensis]|uniref:carboxypeptidase-like regulatory domain-containing protein n=1 Tax=Owenweeksia hongkongensis TaxID=253245 RepID=UPI003A91CB68
MEKKVNITYACPISWESMKAINDKERFCYKCSKKIKDFSKDETIDMRNLECGTFRTGQVGNITRTFNIGKKEILALSLISFLGLVPMTSYSQITRQDSINTAQPDTITPFRFSGTITDKKTGETLPCVNIVLKDSLNQVINGTSTDIDGKFELSIIDTTIDINNVKVEVRYLGYDGETIQMSAIGETCTSVDFNLQLNQSNLSIRGMAIRSVRSVPPNSKIFYEEDIKGAYRR